MAEAAPGRAGLLAPLATPIFAALWVAGIVSSVGTAMQTVASTWMVVAVDPRPGTVAALQAAASAPLFLVGLPAGVLADIVDRRKLLIAANLWMALGAGVLAVAAWLGLASVGVLIGASFAIGLGAAVAAPAFQAIVPELARGSLLAPAVALNSIGMNVARTVGPALGGVALATFGAASVFGVNAASTLVVVGALAFWHRAPSARRLPAEHFISATRASLRYVAFASDVRRVLGRAVAFFLFASAPWALLPLVASKQLHLGASGYGTLLGALGAGAVASALILGRLQSAIGATRLAALATGICAICSVALGLVAREWVAIAVLAVFGGGWLTVLTLLNVGVQTSVEGWIRARMLAIYVVVYFGTFTVGSLLWGQIANLVGIEAALGAAGVVGLGAVAATLLFPNKESNATDLSPAAASEPVLAAGAEDFTGAVLVSTEYKVKTSDASAFAGALKDLGESRRRSGALAWRHWRDPQDETFHRESYVVESWTEYQRQVLRRTVGDDRLEHYVSALAAPNPQTRVLGEEFVAES